MGRSDEGSSGRSRAGERLHAVVRAVLAVTVWIVFSACASAPEVEPPTPVATEEREASPTGTAPAEPGGDPAGAGGERFSEATAALEAGRFDDAYWELQALAGQCRSGEWGRRSVLLLAAHVLDPRNPTRSPDAGARLAARYLQVPSSSAASEALARSLYVHALELGGDPVEDPFGPIPVLASDSGTSEDPDRETAVRREPVGSWRVAPRFRDCDSEAVPVVVRSLPQPPSSTLYGDLEALSRDRDLLTTRVDSLQSELERIRGLLRSGPPQDDSAPDDP